MKSYGLHTYWWGGIVDSYGNFLLIYYSQIAILSDETMKSTTLVCQISTFIGQWIRQWFPESNQKKKNQWYRPKYLSKFFSTFKERLFSKLFWKYYKLKKKRTKMLICLSRMKRRMGIFLPRFRSRVIGLNPWRTESLTDWVTTNHH